MLEQWSKEELQRLESRGLRRAESIVESTLGPRFTLDGREVISLSSNNYLGFAGDPRLSEALAEAARASGVGSGASRLVAGTHRDHRRCEQALAEYSSHESAMLFSSGYAANVGLLSGITGPEDHIFSDALNHASIIDGCRLSRASVSIFPHRDVQALRALLRESHPHARRRFIVTDALFSMDGHLAPLAELRAVADEFGAALIVDEAHSLGVLGTRGQGACQAAGVVADILVGTLGKSFGLSGAFVASSGAAVELLRNRARSYVFSTAPPAAYAATTLHALQLVQEADDRRAALFEHVERLRSALIGLGVAVPKVDGAILPVRLGDALTTMRASAHLLERGVYARGIRPPTVPEGTSRIRLVPMATHGSADIDRVIEALESLPWSQAA